MKQRILFLTMIGAFAMGTAHDAAAGDYHDWAKTPPMGWNSWDYYGTSITEDEAKEQAQSMVKYLLPAGYDIFTVDIQWYRKDPDPNAVHQYDWDGDTSFNMDEYGRLIPAYNRFPSAKNGKGFKNLADYQG